MVNTLLTYFIKKIGKNALYRIRVENIVKKRATISILNAKFQANLWIVILVKNMPNDYNITKNCINEIKDT